MYLVSTTFLSRLWFRTVFAIITFQQSTWYDRLSANGLNLSSVLASLPLFRKGLNPQAFKSIKVIILKGHTTADVKKSINKESVTVVAVVSAAGVGMSLLIIFKARC